MNRKFLPMLVFAACCACIDTAYAQATLTFGQIASSTHPSARTNAIGLTTGINVYFDSVNAQGGVNGRKLMLATKDDGLDAKKMVEMTNDFLADKQIAGLVGYQNTGGLTALVKSDVIGKGGIAMIAPLQGNKEIIEAPNFFPFRSGYADEVEALIKEAKSTQKQKIAILSYNVSFGPSAVKVAEEMARKYALPLGGSTVLTSAASDKSDAALKEAIDKIAASGADSVFVAAAGRGIIDIVKLFRTSAAKNIQIYTMSVALAEDLVKGVGPEMARGVVISQAVPFPFSATLPVVREYQKLMKQYAPEQGLSFSSLEGFIGAKIAVEAVRRAGKDPSRDKILDALQSFGSYDLGGVGVNYGKAARQGWNSVDLTIIGANGKLLR